MAFKKKFLGLSRDHRTNKWELYCPCGKHFSPPTTMLAMRLETCPKCGYEEVVDYNNDDNDIGEINA